jgi:release factor glutamine methyltransferase
MQVNIQQTLHEARECLAKMTDRPVLEAEILLAHVLGKSRVFLHTFPEFTLSADQIEQFTSFIKRRCNKEPVAYITGSREFWSLPLMVSPDTLIPRPESELLVESVLALYSKETTKVIADLGTGCGTIGLALAHERGMWQIVATDKNASALTIAIQNAKQLGIKNINFYQGDWCAALPDILFDVIVSNPPYLSLADWACYSPGLVFEPRDAFLAGADGLNAIREISHSAKKYLKPNGFIFVEHGFLQAEAVRKIFAKEGFSEVHSVRDLAGHERVTGGCWCRPR